MLVWGFIRLDSPPFHLQHRGTVWSGGGSPAVEELDGDGSEACPGAFGPFDLFVGWPVFSSSWLVVGW